MRFPVSRLIPPANILSRSAAQLASSDGWVDHPSIGLQIMPVH